MLAGVRYVGVVLVALALLFVLAWWLRSIGGVEAIVPPDDELEQLGPCAGVPVGAKAKAGCR